MERNNIYLNLTKNRSVSSVLIVKYDLMFTVCFTVPSRIKSVSSGGNIDTKKDSVIKLNCEADGNPVPNITWTRKVT